MTDKALARDMSGEGLISLVTCSVAEQQSVFGNRAAGGLDLGLGGSGCLGALHGDGHGDVTIAENLDRETTTDSALGNQRVNGDLAALREQLPKSGDVDNLVFLLERALEALPGSSGL